MKPEQDHHLEAGRDLSTPGEASVETLQPPEIVGEIANLVGGGNRFPVRFSVKGQETLAD